MENRKALGKGLEQLFNIENRDMGDIEQKIYETASRDEIVEIDINELRPNPYQPRKTFNDETIQELADSIKEYGVFQPIIVKKSIKGYDIIAGERRFRASKLAGKTNIPAIVRDFPDDLMLEIAILENIQRENLNIIEEAEAYDKLIKRLNLTHEELSKKIGKSRSHITNILGLLRLPTEVQKMVSNKQLTMGHARVLSKLESNNQIIDMANKIIEENLPVREVEKMADNQTRINKIIRKRPEFNNDYRYVEDMLRDKLDTKVKIKDKKIEISFSNIADLNRILEIIDIKE